MSQVELSLYSNVAVDSVNVIGSGTRPASREPLAWAVLTAMTTFNVTPAALTRLEYYLPESSTVHMASRPSRASVAPEHDEFATAERIREILRYLGLTKTELKGACRVSRQTLYDWLEGRFEPEATNAARLKEIHDLARVVAQSGEPLSAKVVQRHLSNGRSFAEMLQEPELDFAGLRGFLVALTDATTARRGRSAKAILERMGGSLPADRDQQSNLDDNLETLG